MPSAEIGDPLRHEYREPLLYCANPHCHNPAAHEIRYGDQITYACDTHYEVAAWSFPTMIDRARQLDPGEDIPEGMEPIRQGKSYGPQGFKRRVARTVGARLA